MVKELPSRVDAVARGSHHRPCVRVEKNAHGLGIQPLCQRPQNLRTRLGKGESNKVGQQGPHMGIVGKQHGRHVKLRWEVSSVAPYGSFRVRPAMLLVPESFGCPCPFGGRITRRSHMAFIRSQQYVYSMYRECNCPSTKKKINKFTLLNNSRSIFTYLPFYGTFFYSLCRKALPAKFARTAQNCHIHGLRDRKRLC